MNPDIENISEQFQLEGAFLEAYPLGSGHINDTYVVTRKKNGRSIRTVLQRINHTIFINPALVMDNITRVTNHIHGKLLCEGADDISRRVLTVIPTHTGESYYKDAGGNFWRAYDFIENGKTYDTLESCVTAQKAAQMFGRFLKMLADLPQPALHETIADFHNGPRRFNLFQEALAGDPCHRAGTAETEIGFILKNAEILDVLPVLVRKGEIPIRPTHNDTKINNIIFDENTDEALCVIDLDTVMPGLILYDFGDLVRTATCPAEEDERDLTKVKVQIDLFEGLVKGFVEETKSFMNPGEKRHLVFGGKVIILEQAVRFLADYLQGDVYYKVSRKGHNLDRCRTQIKLFQSLTEQEGEMNDITEKALNMFSL